MAKTKTKGAAKSAPKKTTKATKKATATTKASGATKASGTGKTSGAKSKEYSGLTTIRFGQGDKGPELHKRVAEAAEREGRTLNEHFIHVLSKTYAEGSLILELPKDLKKKLEHAAAEAGNSLEAWLPKQLEALVKAQKSSEQPVAAK